MKWVRSACERIADVRSESEIRASMVKFAAEMGFDTYMVGYTNPKVSGEKYWIENGPEDDFLPTDAAERDPVRAKFMQPQAQAFVWTPTDYIMAGQTDLWETIRDAGMHSGMVCTVRPTGGRRLMFSFDRGGKLDESPAQLVDKLVELSAFSYAVSAQVVGLFDQARDALELLTVQELEILRWVWAGETVQTTAEAMRRPQREVALSLASAVDKLRAPNAIYAAVRAAQLGLFGSN